MNEGIKVTGHVEFIHYRDGIEVARYEHKNLVVTLGRTRLSKLIAGDETAFVTKFRTGTGSTAPAASDSGMQTGVNITTGQPYKAVDNVTYPAAGKVRFEMSLGTSEANGNTLAEYGLFTSDNVLFARVVRPAFAKTSSDSLTIRWTINF